MHEKIDETNFLLYCAKHYDNPNCVSTKEFYEDLKRIKYIKKLFTRYETTGELKERLILNHFIVLYNVFGPEVLPRIVFLKMADQLHFAKPFLILLNALPSVVYNIGKEANNYYTDDIPMDQGIINALRKL